LKKFSRKFPKRGEVWLCELGQNFGYEINNIRPVLVLNSLPKHEKTRVVVPASRTERCTTLQISGFKFLLHQVRAVDTQRFSRKIIRLPKEGVDFLAKKLYQFLSK